MKEINIERSITGEITGDSKDLDEIREVNIFDPHH